MTRAQISCAFWLLNFKSHQWIFRRLRADSAKIWIGHQR
jgi:hypothetical protein